MKLSGADKLLPDEASVLDVGCGPAGIFAVLSENQVTAVDPLLDKYRSEIDHFIPSDYSWVEFIQGDFEMIELDQQFDFIFCLNAINHVHDFDTFIEKLINSMKSAGYLFLTIDTHNFTALKHLARWMPFLDPLHPWQYDLREYTNKFESDSLTLVQTINLKRRFVFDYDLLVLQRN